MPPLVELKVLNWLRGSTCEVSNSIIKATQIQPYALWLTWTFGAMAAMAAMGHFHRPSNFPMIQDGLGQRSEAFGKLFRPRLSGWASDPPRISCLGCSAILVPSSRCPCRCGGGPSLAVSVVMLRILDLSCLSDQLVL